MSRFALFGVFLGSVLLASVSSFAIMNPHKKPEPCESCHSKVPSKEDGESGNYYLLKDSIDDTCHVCHDTMCCSAFTIHGGSHPSNIKDWDRKLFRAPKTLPLHDGYITCSTCHLHSIPDGPSYKMVRIVRIDGKKIDWTELCRDCHSSY